MIWRGEKRGEGIKINIIAFENNYNYQTNDNFIIFYHFK